MDPDAPIARRSGSEQIAEILAYYQIEDEDRKRREAQDKLDRLVANAQNDQARNPRRLGG